MLEIFSAELTDIYFILLIFLTLLELLFVVQVGLAGMQDLVWSLCSRCILPSEGLEGSLLRFRFFVMFCKETRILYSYPSQRM